MSKKYLALTLILLLGFLLRVYNLSRGDAYTDEVLYSFRAIGMSDYDNATYQTTPLQWFDPVKPWWLSLSFHDAPPLVFAIQHFSMRIFGETSFGSRLPSVIFGVISILLLYLIGKKVYGEKVGLFAAAILAVTVNHVYISRTGLLEPYAILFILLTIYLFLESLDNPRYFILAGISLGLALLTKYTTIVIIPICFFYYFIKNVIDDSNKNRSIHIKKSWWIVGGIFLSLVVISPVIIYNLMLYKSVGFFDFQLSYVFGQYPEVWKVAPGKEIGSIYDRLKYFAPFMFQSYSPLLLLAYLVSVIIFSLKLIQSAKEEARKHIFLIVTTTFVLLLIFKVGNAYRFLSMLSPFIVLATGYLLSNIHEKRKVTLNILIIIFVVFEIFYSTNSQILYKSIGRPPLAYSDSLRNEANNYGYNELIKYLEKELAGKRPAILFVPKYKFLEKLQEKAIKQGEVKKLDPQPTVVIYDQNIHDIASLWIFDRLNIYHAWPVITTEEYMNYLKDNKKNITDNDFLSHYFVTPTDKIPQRNVLQLTDTAVKFERQLLNKNIESLEIKNKKDEIVFRVYKF